MSDWYCKSCVCVCFVVERIGSGCWVKELLVFWLGCLECCFGLIWIFICVDDVRVCLGFWDYCVKIVFGFFGDWCDV